MGPRVVSRGLTPPAWGWILLENSVHGGAPFPAAQVPPARASALELPLDGGAPPTEPNAGGAVGTQGAREEGAAEAVVAAARLPVPSASWAVPLVLLPDEPNMLLCPELSPSLSSVSFCERCLVREPVGRQPVDLVIPVTADRGHGLVPVADSEGTCFPVEPPLCPLVPHGPLEAWPWRCHPVGL